MPASLASRAAFARCCRSSPCSARRRTNRELYGGAHLVIDGDTRADRGFEADRQPERHPLIKRASLSSACDTKAEQPTVEKRYGALAFERAVGDRAAIDRIVGWLTRDAGDSERELVVAVWQNWPAAGFVDRQLS